MKFYCDQCNAQYFIADEKIGAKGVKVRCKRCDNVIIIRPPALDEAPADAAASASDDLLGGLGDLSDEPAAPGAAAAPSDEVPSQLGDFGLDLDGSSDRDLEEGAAQASAATADGAGEDSLLAGSDDAAPYSGERATISESSSAPAVAPAPVAHRPTANLTAGGALASEDALDSELAGAFDSVFGAGPVDPFNTVEITGAPDRSKRETRFYSPQEMAQIAKEKQTAQDEDDLIGIGGAAAPAFGLKPGGNGNGEGEAGDDMLAPGPVASPAAAEMEFDRDPVWYVAINEQQVGPLSLTELSDRWDRREVDADSLIWKSSLSDWMPVRDVAELRSFVSVKSASRHDAQLGGATEVERPRTPVGLNALDAAVALDAHAILGNASMPSDAMSDPFANVESSDLPPPGGIASGSWRPHGMTEIYQAASLAESSAMQPAPMPAQQPVEEEVDWNPGAAAALASLVDEEIKSVATKPSAGSMLPTADDGDLQLAPAGASPYNDMLSTAPLPTPRSSASSMPTADPFASQLSSPGAGDVDIAQIAGQSSMVMQRPSYLTEPPKSERKINWLLWGGVGAGGLLLVTILIVLVVLLVKVLSPPPAVATNQGNNMQQVGGNNPGSPNQPPGTANPPGNQGTQPTGAVGQAGTPASQPTAADQIPVTPSPPISSPGEVDDAKDPKKTKTTPAKRPLLPKATGSKPLDDGSPVPTPATEQPPIKKASGDCDPVLGCPPEGGGTGPMPINKPVGGAKPLSKADILMTVKKNMGAIKACSAEQAKRDKRLATGELKMSWYVRPDGKTKNVSIMTAKFKGTYVGGCVQDSISKWQFPPFEGDDVGPIKFPFSLE